MKYNGSIALERSVTTHKHISTSCLLVQETLFTCTLGYKQELRGGRYRTCIGQSQQTVKYSSMAPGQGVCLKGMSRTITMPGFRFATISDVEKTQLRRKNFQSQWTVKYRSRAPG